MVRTSTGGVVIKVMSADVGRRSQNEEIKKEKKKMN